MFAKAELPDDSFFDTAQSISNIRWRDRNKARERKITLIRANGNTTFASLAKRSSLGDYAEEKLRLLNGMYPDGEPRPGQLIKIIK